MPAPSLPLCPAPAEVRLGSLSVEADTLLLTLETYRRAVPCPRCRQPSARVHSRYQRTLADLPWHGVAVRLVLSSRRFFCDSPACPQRIFTERLPATAAPYARRTERLTAALRALAFATGGEVGARLAAVLGMAASPNTLLRRIRDTVLPEPAAPRVVGLDDWAWRKGLRYGTILVDLERQCVLDLLPDREVATVAAWLAAHPGIEVVSRDRAGAYAEAVRQGAPQAIQVADRFHLVKNLGDAVQRILGRHGRLLREVAHDVADTTAASASPAGGQVPTSAAALHRPDRPLASALQASADSRARRLARYEQVIALRAAGATLEEIATTLGMGCATVHRWVHTDGFPERAKQRRLSDAVAETIRQRWTSGCHDATAIWRALVADGFTGSKRTVQREIGLLGLTHAPPVRERHLTVRPPSPRHVAWLFGRDAAAGTDEDRAFLTALCARSPALATVRILARRFVQLTHDRDVAGFDAWLTAAAESELRGFVRRLQSDAAAVRAAFSTPWSNGQTEGQVNRLKLLKRAAFGRAGFAVLRQRVRRAA
jgi:transposase